MFDIRITQHFICYTYDYPKKFYAVLKTNNFKQNCNINITYL